MSSIWCFSGCDGVGDVFCWCFCFVLWAAMLQWCFVDRVEGDCLVLDVVSDFLGVEGVFLVFTRLEWFNCCFRGEL